MYNLDKRMKPKQMRKQNHTHNRPSSYRVSSQQNVFIYIFFIKMNQRSAAQ